MEKSKVVDLLKCLKTSEISDFRKMLNSPFFTRKEVVKSLFEYLIKFHPEFEDNKNLDKSVVFRKVFKEKVPSDEKQIVKVLKNPSYDLKNLLEEFFIQQELNEQLVKKKYLLFDRYSEMGKDDLAVKELKLIEKDLVNLPIGEESFYQNYKLYNAQYLYRKKLKHSTKKLDQLLTSLEDLKALQFLKFGLEAILKNELFNDDNISFDKADFVKIAEEHQHSSSVLLSLYARLLLLQSTDKDDAYFDELVTLFFQSNTLINNEQKNVSISLINYSNRKMQEGHTHYVREFFEIYRTSFEKNIFINDDKSINPEHFRNVVIMGCKLKEFEWVESFIEEHADSVKGAKQNNVKILSFVLLEFNKGNYEKALESSRDVEFKDIYDKLIVKNLVLQCYYELAEYALLDYFSSAYKKFLHTNPLIGETRKKRVLNFITMTHNLANHKATGKPSLNELANHLSRLSPVAQYGWLVQKIELL